MIRALFIALICGALGWFIGEPIRLAANRFLPSKLGTRSMLPENRLPSARPWKEVLQDAYDNWPRLDLPEDFRQAYQTFDQLEPPASACTLARLITEWYEIDAEDLFAFALEIEDAEFTNKILQLAFHLDASEALSFVSGAIHDDAERDQALRSWLLKASDADSSRMRNLIVEHGLASENDDPLLQFADDQTAWEAKETPEPKAAVPEESVQELWAAQKDTEALEDSYTAWMKSAPEAARRWVVEQGDLALLDLWRVCQVKILTESPGGTPRSAYELSLQITHAPQQQRSLERALRHWVQVDPQGALEAIQQAPVEETFRDELSQRAKFKIALLKVLAEATR